MDDKRTEFEEQQNIEGPGMEQPGIEEQEQKSGLVRWMDSFPRRSCILMAVAGAYLIYLGYGLCKGVVQGTASMGFIVPGVLFVVVGALLLFVGGRGLLKEAGEQNNAPEEGETEEEASEESPEETEKEPQAGQKPASIRARANLVDHIREEEEMQNEEPAAGTDSEENKI